jgi:hypothetical protein
MLQRAYLSLSGAAIFLAQNQPEAPGGRGDDPGRSAVGVMPHRRLRLGSAVKVLGGGGLPSHDTRRWGAIEPYPSDRDA